MTNNLQNLNEIICQGRDEALAKSRSTFPQHTHRISSIGHPCKRFLYYSIHDWDKVEPVPLSLQAIFRLGKKVEGPLITFFNEEVGPRCNPRLRLIEHQLSIVDATLKKYNISGTPDAVLAEVDGEGNTVRLIGVVDVKSCSQSMLRSYSDIDSLRRHTWSYLYIAQPMLYSFALNLPTSFLFFASKQNIFYDWKIIELPLDYGYIEGILQKCQEVNDHLAAEIEPDKLNQPFWCKGCRFESYCLPEMEPTGEGPILNESEEIQSLVDRVRELEPAFREYKKTHDELKGKLIPDQPLLLRNEMLDWTSYDVADKFVEAHTKKGFHVSKMKFVQYTGDTEDSD